MATRVRTFADLSASSLSPSEPVQRTPQTLLSSHPDMLIPDTSLLQTIRVRGSSGPRFVPTAEGPGTRHRPTYSGPSNATRAILGGIGGLVQGGTRAYVQYATTAQYLQDTLDSRRPDSARADHACPAPEQPLNSTAPNNDAFIHGETHDGAPIINESTEQPTDVNSDPQHGHDILQDVAIDTQGHANAASQSETIAINDPEVPAQASTVPTAQVQGDIEVRFRHEGFDIGSGGHEHARPLDAAAHDRDIGFQMFSTSRTTRFMRLGTAQDLLDGNHAATSEPIAWLDHHRVGAGQGIRVELRNPTTGMTREVQFDGSGGFASTSELYLQDFRRNGKVREFAQEISRIS